MQYEEQAGHFWHIKYPLIEEDGSISKTTFLEFATTRPETMLPSDPDMLASFLNMKLRDHYATLDALCEDLELDKEELVKKLKEADYD